MNDATRDPDSAHPRRPFDSLRRRSPNRVILCAVGHIALGARSGTLFPMSAEEPRSWAFAGCAGLDAEDRVLLESD